MEEHLYLFEVLVDSIYFDESVLEIPQKKQIVVSVKLGNIVTLEIRSETLPVGSQSGNKRLIDFKSGRSHLIPLHKEKLLQDLNSHSLEVNVRGRGDVKPIGSSSAPWDDSFKEMVQESDEEFVTPAFIDDNFCLLENGAIRGNVQMFLRLSCFGKSIQTQFEVLQESGNKQFLFKTPNMATTFICSKYGAGASTDFLPIGPLYNSGHMKPEKVSHPISPSWTAVMHGNSSSTMEKHNSTVSVCLFPEYLSLVPPVKDSAITFDIASLRARPEEDKFLDFLTGKKFGDLQGSLHSFLVSGHEKIAQKVCGRINYQEIKVESSLTRIPLRLRGGGPCMKSYRLRAGAPYKSPVAECQEIMNQFDKILDEYKKAIAPCGQIGCDYAPNVTEDLCWKSCGNKPESTYTTGCGLPDCQYAKYKSALMAMDADIEKQFIGPVILGNCGHPKCSYRADPVLPPIHWDCPEPLPTGKCKNPKCPYPSPDTLTQGKFSSTKGPCGSDQCPYAPPPPCSSPNCPFKNQNLPPCTPMKKNSSKVKKSSKPKDKTCSSCPFDNPPQIVNMMLCDNPNCENKKVESAGDCWKRKKACGSPNCPYRNLLNEASNPNCPLPQSEAVMKSSQGIKEGKSSRCMNPSCPFSIQSIARTCSEPDCPFNKSSSSFNESNASACSNPDCPFRSDSKDEKEPPKEACANPECPFNIPSVESCKNPECPFLNSSPVDSNESCDNPNCPYKKDSKISEESECACENPECPSKKETCANPNCPFNLRDLDVCTNPECSHMKDALGRDLGFCASLPPSFNEFCGNQTCPYHDRGPEKKQEESNDKQKTTETMENGESIEQGEEEKTAGDRFPVYDMAPCTLKSCRYMGGHLVCKECGFEIDGKRRGPCPKTCPGDPLCNLATERKSKKYNRLRELAHRRTCAIKKGKKKRKMKSHGDIDYPGYRIGHRECVMPFFYVPPRMGWLWNIHTPCMNLKPRRGWRPGAITKTVAKAILKHKQESMNIQAEKTVKRRRNHDASYFELMCPKPTLEIKKREGIYHITMNPLKDPEKLQMNENPYVDCNPMQFKVAKENLMDPDCICTDEGEYYKNDSSSDDELDIQVTTPAGIIHPDRPIKKKVMSAKETQYNSKDIPPPPKKSDKKKKKGDKEDEEKNKNEKNKLEQDKNAKGKIEKGKTGKEKDKNEKAKGDKDKSSKEKAERDKNPKDKNAKDKAEKEKNMKDRVDKDKNVKIKLEKEKSNVDKGIKDKKK